MTKEEIAFKAFEKKYSFDWYAQPDGGNKTVVFCYYKKGMYLNSTDYESPVKFEAESLEKAFNYAFIKESLLLVSPIDIRDLVGTITKFSISKWATIEQPKYYTTANGIIRCLKDVLEYEYKNKLEKAI